MRRETTNDTVNGGRFRFSLKSATVAVLVVACLLAVIINYGMRVATEIRVTYARSHVELFWDMVDSSDGAPPQDIAANLRYVLDYYPAGTILSADSDVSRIVEINRTRAAAQLVRMLRASSEIDHGDDPRV